MSSDKPSPALWTDDERWQILMENVKDYGIFMLDPAGVIVTWSTGAERILEQPEFELHEAQEKGRAEDERWHLRKDGSRFWASGVVTPLRDEHGSLRGFVK